MTTRPTPATDMRTLSDLTSDPRNANRGTPRGREALRHSLHAFSAGRAVLIDRHGVVIAGNKTVAEARAQAERRTARRYNDQPTRLRLARLRRNSASAFACAKRVDVLQRPATGRWPARLPVVGRPPPAGQPPRRFCHRDIAMGLLVGAVQADTGLAGPLTLIGVVFVLLQILTPIHGTVNLTSPGQNEAS